MLNWILLVLWILMGVWNLFELNKKRKENLEYKYWFQQYGCIWFMVIILLIERGMM